MEQKLLSFEKKGTIILDEILDKNECDKLVEKVKKQEIGQQIFLDLKKILKKILKCKKQTQGVVFKILLKNII